MGYEPKNLARVPMKKARRLASCRFGDVFFEFRSSVRWAGCTGSWPYSKVSPLRDMIIVSTTATLSSPSVALVSTQETCSREPSLTSSIAALVAFLTRNAFAIRLTDAPASSPALR
jgi:hypothetical protein